MVKPKKHRHSLRLGRSFKLGRLISLFILVVVMIVSGKAALSYKDSGWVDLTDTQSQAQPPTMNIGQINVSLKDILKQYENLLASAGSMNKDSMLSKLSRLYQLSAKDYSNATALPDPSDGNGVLQDLSLGSGSLTSSIFEKEDSLLNTGVFSTTQDKKSKEDLTSAINTLGKVNLTPKS